MQDRTGHVDVCGHGDPASGTRTRRVRIEYHFLSAERVRPAGVEVRSANLIEHAGIVIKDDDFAHDRKVIPCAQKRKSSGNGRFNLAPSGERLGIVSQTTTVGTYEVPYEFGRIVVLGNHGIHERCQKDGMLRKGSKAAAELGQELCSVFLPPHGGFARSGGRALTVDDVAKFVQRRVHGLRAEVTDFSRLDQLDQVVPEILFGVVFGLVPQVFVAECQLACVDDREKLVQYFLTDGVGAT